MENRILIQVLAKIQAKEPDFILVNPIDYRSLDYPKNELGQIKIGSVTIIGDSNCLRGAVYPFKRQGMNIVMI